MKNMMSNKKLIIVILLSIVVIGIGLLVLNRPSTAPIPTQETTITIDKLEYKQGEPIKITARNGLNRSIWYADFGCYPWWRLEKQENKDWRSSIELLLPITTKYGEECIACPPPELMEDVLKELKPNSEISKAWNQKNCTGSIPAFINKGNYRLSFAYGLSKDDFTEKTAYSNEFTIKEREEKEYNSVIRCGGGSCRCMKEKECEPYGGVYIIPTDEGECSANSDNKMCCCPGV